VVLRFYIVALLDRGVSGDAVKKMMAEDPTLPKIWEGIVTEVKTIRSDFSEGPELAVVFMPDGWHEELVVPVRNKVLIDEVMAVQPQVGETMRLEYHGTALRKGIEPGSAEADEPRNNPHIFRVSVLERPKPSPYLMFGPPISTNELHYDEPVANDDAEGEPEDKPDWGPVPY
jgi:hypothetical protein